MEFYDQFKSLLEDEEFSVVDTELGFILLDHHTLKMSYIGSGVNLVVKKPNTTEIYSTRKSRITKKTEKSVELSLASGDQLFLYTDGIPDQFDAMNEKKLTSRGLLKLLDMAEEEVTLENFTNNYNTFKGATLPFDDQTLLILTV